MSVRARVWTRICSKDHLALPLYPLDHSWKGHFHGHLDGIVLILCFSWDPEAALPNAIPPSLARELTLLCGPGFIVFKICSVAWSLPARDDTWRTKLLMECPLQWPVRKCHWTWGWTQRHLFQLGGHLNVKIIVFFSFPLRTLIGAWEPAKWEKWVIVSKADFSNGLSSYWASVNAWFMQPHSLS